MILDINMPIMDGYESCKLISDYLNDSTPIMGRNELLGHDISFGNRSLIYSLTSDYSDFTNKKLRQYPFDNYFYNLGTQEIE